MRVIAGSAWGITREHVIGTTSSYEFQKKVKSDAAIIFLGGLALEPGKVEHIFAYAKRMPAFAGGNAEVDIEILGCSRFSMLVVHDDAEREFAYTKAGAEFSSGSKGKRLDDGQYEERLEYRVFIIQCRRAFHLSLPSTSSISPRQVSM